VIERWRAGLSGSRKGRETLSNKTKNHQLVLMPPSHPGCVTHRARSGPDRLGARRAHARFRLPHR
jgi:hypothetical protein